MVLLDYRQFNHPDGQCIPHLYSSEKWGEQRRKEMGKELLGRLATIGRVGTPLMLRVYELSSYW